MHLFATLNHKPQPGVELAGALKNVLAIGCGMVDGLDFGGNGRAALITRGHSEIVRLAVALGAHPLTLSGLAGIGDIVLTCTGAMLHLFQRMGLTSMRITCKALWRSPSAGRHVARTCLHLVCMAESHQMPYLCCPLL